MSLRGVVALLLSGTATATFAVTYEHIVTFAVQHGQSDWTALVYPFFIDGFEVIVTLYLFYCKRDGQATNVLAWTFLVVIVLVSVAVNWLSSPKADDTLSHLFAALPAIALLGEIKIMATLLGHKPTTATSGTATRADSEPDPAVRALLPAARAARDQLATAGHKLTRQNLADQIRRNGQPVSNERACELLKILTQPTHAWANPLTHLPGLHKLRHRGQTGSQDSGGRRS
ncbi:DUF2637 domain-containing protein [Fodinicola feengrottensis]|uniref:DUF2637 domain-containing protein n=1 Tax=Fodinicola feengrottensis TaxID=435914 RepID=UPI0031D897C5